MVSGKAGRSAGRIGRVLKISVTVVGLLLVLAVGAVVVLATLVDPNDYKPKITELVLENTGRELTWHGDLELAFFPWLGVKTGRVELANGAGFTDIAELGPMLAVDAAAIRVKLLPLLKKRVEVDTVRLHKPRIHLFRRADGVANWDDLALLIRRAAGDDDDARKSPPDAALLAGLAVQGVSIQGGRVDWDDRAAGQTMTLRALNLDTGKLLPGEPLAVNASVDAEGSYLPERSLITLATTAQLAENLESVSLDNTEIKFAAQSITADVSVVKISYTSRAGFFVLGKARNERERERMFIRDRTSEAAQRRITQKRPAGRAGLVALNGLRGNAKRNGVDTRLLIPSLQFNRADESLLVPRVKLQQGDFVLAGKLSGTVNYPSMLDNGGDLMSAIKLGGRANVSTGGIADLLERNGFDPDLAGVRVDDLTASFDFAFVNRRAEVKQFSARFRLNREPTRLSVPYFGFTPADEGVKLPQFNLLQRDFSLLGSLNGAGMLSEVSLMTATGDVDARSDNIKDLMRRNDFTITPPPGLPDSVAAGFQFELADNTLTLRDVAVASLEEQGGNSLFERTEIVIPFTADGAPEYDRALAGLLRAQAERKLTEWLRGQLRPAFEAEKTDSKVGELEKKWKKKLGDSVRKVLGGE